MPPTGPRRRRPRPARTENLRCTICCTPCRRCGRRFLGPHGRRPGRHRRQDRRHLQRDRRRQPAHGAAARARRRRWSAAKARPASASSSASPAAPGARWKSSVNTLIDDLLWPTTRSDPRGRRGGARATCCRPCGSTSTAARCKGEFLQLGHHRQHDDQAARRVHLGSDARRARGRHRRQARRPGAGAGSDRRVEGPDRERQLDGVEPDRRRSATSPK